MSEKKYTKSQIKEILEDTVKFAKNSKISDLVSFLKYCSLQYYNTDKEVIDDKTYDEMYEILEERDPKNKFLNEIGAPETSKDKVKLPYPLGSLNKIKPDKIGTNKLKKWIKTHPGPYSVSDKLDGMSAMLIKVSNVQVELYSRGDGVEGKNISHLVKVLFSDKVIKKIPIGTAIRGEIVISNVNFDKFLKKKFKNPRSAMAGFINSDDGEYDIDAAKYADFVAYNIIHPPELNQIKKLDKLNDYGLKVVWHSIIDNNGNDYTDNESDKSDEDDDDDDEDEDGYGYDELDENEDDELDEDEELDDNAKFILFQNKLKALLIKRREESKYDIDGIVCIDSSKIHKHDYGNPKYGFAFKMKLADQIATVKVVDIEWEPSMYARMKPTVIIEPVEIKGSTIERATGHNAKYIKDNKIGKGTIIKIIKSGDVIPYILEVVTPSNEPLLPTIKYRWSESGYDIIATNISGNIGYKIGIKRATHFFKTLKVKWLSEGIIAKMYYGGFNSVFKILEADPDELEEIDGIGSKLIKKVYGEITKKINNVKMHVLMAASLQFDMGIGVKKLKCVTDKYPDIMTMNDKNLHNKLMELTGFSEITTDQFIDNFDNFKKFYKKLKSIKTIDISHLEEKKDKKEKDKKDKKEKDKKFIELDGKKIVFTGFRDDDLQDFIINNGGNVSTTVSKNTDLVIFVNKKGEKSSKLSKAEDLGVKLIEKEKFIKQYNL